jgi:hypothetical protein
LKNVKIAKNNYFTIREIFIMIKDFIILLVNVDYKKNISLKNYMEDNNLPKKQEII